MAIVKNNITNLVWLEKPNFHNRSVSDLRTKPSDAGYAVGCATLTYGYENSPFQDLNGLQHTLTTT